MFHQYIGIDYSGRGTSSTRTSAIQIYQSVGGNDPSVVLSPSATKERHRNWCREEAAEWLVDQLQGGRRLIVGIDHGFSLPKSYMQRFGISTWPDFLEDFCHHWPTDQPNITVDDIRERLRDKAGRIGSNDEFRLTELWTSSAKSVFQFDIQGSVAKSTHAGIPWIQRIRSAVGENVHFWPFDGWKIPKNKSVIAEVFPSIFRQRYPRHERRVDAQDAYSVARWLAEGDQNRQLQPFFKPFLSPAQLKLAKLEGWILGIM